MSCSLTSLVISTRKQAPHADEFMICGANITIGKKRRLCRVSALRRQAQLVCSPLAVLVGGLVLTLRGPARPRLLSPGLFCSDRHSALTVRVNSSVRLR